MPKSFLDLMAERVVLFDGAMGTEIHKLELGERDWAGKVGCSEVLNLSAPEAIRGIHEAYLAAGSDVVETNTFGANEIVLAEYGLEAEVERINAEGARLARSAAAAAGGARFVAGSLGPGTKLVSLGQTDYDRLRSSYARQAAGLLEGGVDLFLVETCQDLLQIKAALHALADVQAERGSRLPVLVSVTVETSGTLLVGSELEAVYAALEPFPLAALGLNCATGPEDMRPYVKQLAGMSRFPLIVQPNAGLPRNEAGRTVYPLGAGAYAAAMRDFVRDDGVRLAGGCCGTTPAHIAELAALLGGLDAPAVRLPAQARPAVTSLYSPAGLRQDPGPFFAGERTNTNGSKRFRERLLADDWDGLVEIAREQAGSGAHAIDLCVAYAGRDEAADMREALSRIVRQVNVPVFIDTTELPVLEAALKLYGGRPVINSINLEDGEKKTDAVCRLAKRFGAALIALTIDERGMAKDAARKLEVAKRLYSIAVGRHGLRPADLIFDALTFTLGSGDAELADAALETIEGIRLIKAELPGVFTVLGVSNISFGLAPASREVLNSVFLAESVKAGLDIAIINVASIIPLERIEPADAEAALNLLNNKAAAGGTGNPLFDFIGHFEKRQGAGAERTAAEPEDLPVEERLRRAIVRGRRAGLDGLLEAARAGRSALDIINGLLIPAMKEVGELFGSGKMQLPFVLQSAEVMKAAVDLLKPFIEKSESRAAKKLVLATVRGDVHDIGKNLVDIILSNNGFEVHNLGIKCEIDTMLRKAEEIGADAVGMSGLLVKSTVVMKENLEEMRRRGLKLPVLLGGAALTPRYVYESCAAAYDGPLLHCTDAFEGLKAMRLLEEGGLAETAGSERRKWAGRPAPAHRLVPAAAEAAAVEPAPDIPEPPFWGSRVAADIDLDSVYPFLTEEVLFRGRWGYRRGSLTTEEYSDLIEKTVRPEFEELKRRCKAEGLLEPKIAYGYFPACAQGDEVAIYDPGEPSRELARLGFPRQKRPPHACIADYFLPAGAGRRDLIALQVATVGMRAMRRSQELYAANRYKDYLLFHGLSVETAEALAEYWHMLVRRELGIAGADGAGIQDFVVQKYRGSRYSFGYPACPDLKYNRTLIELLDAGRIGVSLTDEDQMVPEQTTSAFIVHHPRAKYFTID